MKVQRWLARGSYMESASGWPHRSPATRRELHTQLGGAVQNNGRPDRLRPAAGRVVSEICAGADGHRICDSNTSVRGLKLGVQYRRVGLIVLTCPNDMFGRHDEVTALREVEQSAKHGLRIEPGKAQPRNAAVQTDEGRSRPVTNQTHVFESRVLAFAVQLAEVGVQLHHDSTHPWCGRSYQTKAACETSASAVRSTAARTDRCVSNLPRGVGTPMREDGRGGSGAVAALEV